MADEQALAAEDDATAITKRTQVSPGQLADTLNVLQTNAMAILTVLEQDEANFEYLRGEWDDANSVPYLEQLHIRLTNLRFTTTQLLKVTDAAARVAQTYETYQDVVTAMAKNYAAKITGEG